MTIVELFLFFVAVIAIYYMLAPLRRRIEAYLFKLFRKKNNNEPGPVIDITDYSKRNKSK